MKRKKRHRLRYVFMKGAKIPVSDSVYSAFKRPVWAERKRRQKRAGRELSLDVFLTSGFDMPSNDPLVDEIVADKLLLEMLISALGALTEDERFVIEALFFDGKSERKLASETGCSKTSVHKRKIRILGKLKKLLS